MATGQHQNASSSPQNDESIKLAVAISLLRSKLLHCRNQNADDPSSESDALRWKRKAKDRKQELLRLREDLREAEDALHYDLLPQSASCKCYFFDNLGKLSPSGAGDRSDYRFNDVLRRRFLRQVRLQERRRRRTSDSTQRRRFTDLNSEDEVEQLRASVDFLVDLCDTVSPAEEANFANWSHQAVDFILGQLSILIKHCPPLWLGRQIILAIGKVHMIRKLAFDPYIGHRVILLVSQRISVLAEKLLFSDPFDDAFPNMHSCMFLLMQLMEFVISEYLVTWSRAEAFDSLLFEEWVKSVLQARKAAELLENRNGLYVLYMDRVTGLLTKQVGQISSLPKFNRDILDKLFL
ncbi:protein MULTIPOLAR SPINDLE 1 [Citrus sinensis]|uniref:Protein MULTIPOLAR SPINDLE 1 n=1 Tax=Citrus sinensis TaxID=2711 RepID=A0ACB8P772_CITSI|nr:protein MULTIPOLAR SPINDLE 1 [Citrus sinensis]